MFEILGLYPKREESFRDLLYVGRTGGRQYEVVVLDAEPKALRGGRYLSVELKGTSLIDLLLEIYL